MKQVWELDITGWEGTKTKLVPKGELEEYIDSLTPLKREDIRGIKLRDITVQDITR